MTLLSLLALLVQDPYIRTHDQEVRPVHWPGNPVHLDGGGVELAYPPPCTVEAQGRHGEAVPGGGTLNPVAFGNPATIIGPASGDARSAFVSQVSGAPRNQGVFVHDGTTLVPIAMGCGALGGGGSVGACGDPSPIGGTFSGFFTGTMFAPAVNAAGDVLFMADVFGGTAVRGLFLYRAASGTIVKVAAPGDASPLGGTFANVGPGSINAAGDVAFLAGADDSGTSDVFLWSAGVVTKVAAVGDAAPLASTYQFLGTEAFGFADGTTIPVGPLPDIDDSGNVVFRAITAGGRRGIVHRTAAGVATWLVRDLEATPAGGTFLDMQAASLNEAGEIAFFADVRLSASDITSGWFVGTPGNWRAGLVFFDPVAGGECFGLAFSRNPMSPLDDDGNLLMWTDVRLPNSTMREHLVARARDGALTIVARRGDPAPGGGSFGGFDAWPSLDDHGRGTISCATPGAPAGSLSAHFLFEVCPAAASAVRNGSNANPLCLAGGPPVLGSTWTPTVDASGHPGAMVTFIAFQAAPIAGQSIPYGELLLDLASPRYFTSRAFGSGLVPHALPIPDDATLAGVPVYAQGLILGGGAQLCNALDLVLGY